MTNFLFPKASNKKGEAQIGLEDFASLTPKKERKGDITYKDKRFTLASSFVKDRTADTGFVPVIDAESNKAYFLKSTTPETFKQTKAVRGEKGSRIFTSESLEFAVKHAGLSLENPLYLNHVRSEGGFEVYELSNKIEETSSEPAKVEEQAPEVEENTDVQVNPNNPFPAQPVELPQTPYSSIPAQTPAQPQEESVNPSLTEDNSSLTDLL